MSQAWTPTTSVDWALLKIPVDRRLFVGIPVMKITSNGVRKIPRILTLSQDRCALYISRDRIQVCKQNRLKGIINPIINIKEKTLTTMRAKRKFTEDGEKVLKIDISSIERVQAGIAVTQKFELLREQSQQTVLNFPEEVFVQKKDTLLSVIYNGKQSVNFVIQKSDDMDVFISTINALKETYQVKKLNVGNDELILRYIWLDMDTDKSGTINVKEASRILQRLNFSVKKAKLKRFFTAFIKNRNIAKNVQEMKGLTFIQSVRLINNIKKIQCGIQPIDQIWNELFGEETVWLTTDVFLNKFIHGTQRDFDVTKEHVEELFSKLNRMEIFSAAATDVDKIDKKRLESYLLSEENDVYDPKKLGLNPSLMTRPLSHYWINSSHNTYLTGDQIQSQSSAEMYLNALYRGCRCLEIDCWDGWIDEGGKPIPITYHGKTLTSKIPFEDVLKAIRIFTLKEPSCYPIIISLENHCSRLYQREMASQIRDILGNSLFAPSWVAISDLPSPDSLKGIVIFKGRLTTIAEIALSERNISIEIKAKSHIDGEVKSSYDPNREQLVYRELSSLTFLQSLKTYDFERTLDKRNSCMVSINASRLQKISNKVQGTKQIKKFNNKHLTRIYPSGDRILSSNYDPVVSWSNGCQLVALNIQTPDSPLLLNDGLFRQNGGSGYVLKPCQLIDFDGSDSENNVVTSLRLRVKVLSGYFLPKPQGQSSGNHINPFVKLSVSDVFQGKGAQASFSTNSVMDNGLCPVWDSEEFIFTIRSSYVAMILFQVFDRNRTNCNRTKFIAGAAIPISCLRQGYRSVQLYDSNNSRKGAYAFASLLIKTSLIKI